MARWKKSKLFYIRIGDDGDVLGPYRKHEIRWAIKSEKDAKRAVVRGEHGSWVPYAQYARPTSLRDDDDDDAPRIDVARAKMGMVVGVLLVILALGFTFTNKWAFGALGAGAIVFGVNLNRFMRAKRE